MADLVSMPEEVNLELYSGDTITIHVKVLEPSLIAGRTFFAQIRSKQTSTKIDATLAVIVTEVGADLVLSTEDGRRLTARGPYSGWWDVQLAMADGNDPVTTLAYGEFKLNPDVTRIPA